MDVKFRPEGLRHRQAAMRNIRQLAVAVFVAAITLAATMRPLHSAVTVADVTASLSPAIPADHRMATGPVPAGQEALSISAMFSVSSTRSLPDVQWKITRAGGDIVFRGTGAEITEFVTPGQYVVEARYGNAIYADAFSVERGKYVSVNFILNIGAVRILPVVAGVDGAAVKAVSKVYALSGLDRGKLVSQSTVPGEVLKLMEGLYRIESTFIDGNVTAVTDIAVSAGIMSAVEFRHNAGVARLAHSSGVNGDVSWTILSRGAPVLAFTGQQARDVVLAPGHYQATASSGGKVFTTDFDLAVGEMQTITLGQ